MIRAFVVAILVLAACGGGTPRKIVIPTDAPAEYPGVLHDPATLKPNFMVRQTLTLRSKSKYEGKPVEGEIDAVLQKDGDSILIIGFGPMNIKAFTLLHKGGTITFENFVGRELPFSPRNILVDVHRVFFKRLPAPVGPNYSGVQRGQLDGETLEETWQDGELRASTFTRPGDTLKGAVRIQFGTGCAPDYCEPETAMLRNEWFGYTLTIANESFERL